MKHEKFFCVVNKKLYNYRHKIECLLEKGYEDCRKN